MERTLVIIKPDAVERKLMGEIISRYEKKGLNISEMKMLRAGRNLLEAHYSEHFGKDYYENLINYMMRGPVAVMIVEGSNAVESVRKINGLTDPLKAETGSIRGDYALSVAENLVHASDSRDSAEKEIGIWFGQ